MDSTAQSNNNESDVHKKISEAFNVFDHEQNNLVDIREIGTIIRSLGHCPSEAELREILRDLEEPHQMGYVHFERFLPVMTNIVVQRRFPPASAADILTAFKVLDVNKEGELDQDYIIKLFSEGGEPFNSEEVDEMLKAAVNPDTKKVAYQNFIHFLSLDN